MSEFGDGGNGGHGGVGYGWVDEFGGPLSEDFLTEISGIEWCSGII